MSTMSLFHLSRKAYASFRSKSRPNLVETISFTYIISLITEST